MRHADDRYLIAVLRLDLVEVRDAADARPAPGRPELEDDDRIAVMPGAHLDRFAAHPFGDGKRRCRVADAEPPRVREHVKRSRIARRVVRMGCTSPSRDCAEASVRALAGAQDAAAILPCVSPDVCEAPQARSEPISRARPKEKELLRGDGPEAHGLEIDQVTRDRTIRADDDLLPSFAKRDSSDRHLGTCPSPSWVSLGQRRARRRTRPRSCRRLPMAGTSRGERLRTCRFARPRSSRARGPPSFPRNRGSRSEARRRRSGRGSPPSRREGRAVRPAPDRRCRGDFRGRLSEESDTLGSPRSNWRGPRARGQPRDLRA